MIIIKQQYKTSNKIKQQSSIFQTSYIIVRKLIVKYDRVY